MSQLPKPEKRKALTRLQFAKLALDQEGKCGCGCGQKLDFNTPRAIVDEHIQPLDQLGSNDLSNRSLWIADPCAKNKTKADNSRAAKGKRIRGETRTKTRGRKLKSGGFAAPPEGYVSPLNKNHPNYKKTGFRSLGSVLKDMNLIEEASPSRGS